MNFHFIEKLKSSDKIKFTQQCCDIIDCSQKITMAEIKKPLTSMENHIGTKSIMNNNNPNILITQTQHDDTIVLLYYLPWAFYSSQQSNNYCQRSIQKKKIILISVSRNTFT